MQNEIQALETMVDRLREQLARIPVREPKGKSELPVRVVYLSAASLIPGSVDTFRAFSLNDVTFEISEQFDAALPMAMRSGVAWVGQTERYTNRATSFGYKPFSSPPARGYEQYKQTLSGGYGNLETIWITPRNEDPEGALTPVTRRDALGNPTFPPWVEINLEKREWIE